MQGNRSAEVTILKHYIWVKIGVDHSHNPYITIKPRPKMPLMKSRKIWFRGITISCLLDKQLSGVQSSKPANEYIYIYICYIWNIKTEVPFNKLNYEDTNGNDATLKGKINDIQKVTRSLMDIPRRKVKGLHRMSKTPGTSHTKITTRKHIKIFKTITDLISL